MGHTKAMLRYESVAVAALQLRALPACCEPLRLLLSGLFLCNHRVYCDVLAGYESCAGRMDRCGTPFNRALRRRSTSIQL